MLRRGEHVLIRVAVAAFRHAEIVRLVALRAQHVAGRERVRLAVAGQALTVDHPPLLVDAVTVATAPRAGVVGLVIVVAARTIDASRHAVRIVALGADDVAMRVDRRIAKLRPIVAAHAVVARDRLRSERVAVLTWGRVDPGMERRDHLRVAPRAELGWRRREPVLAVAVGAHHLADMRGVPGARRDVVIARGHALGDAIAAASARHDRDEHERAHHGRDPIG
jgi:hypothetical protein